MTLRTLIRRSLRFHWRAHLGVVLGAAVGSAALIGALVVGDSVKQSLRERVQSRLGQVGFALEGRDRFVTDRLADRMSQPLNIGRGGGAGSWANGWDFPSGIFAGFGLHQPVQILALNGLAAREDGAARANNVQLLGAPDASWEGKPRSDSRFYYLFGLEEGTRIEAGSVWVNNALARQLRISVGDRVVLRIRKPSALASDAPISPRNEQTVVLRVTVERILPASSLADFSLLGTQTPPLNAFVNREELQKATEMDGRVNVLLHTPLYGSGRKIHHAVEKLRNNQKIPAWIRKSALLDSLDADREAPSGLALSKLAEMLQANWKLADLEAELRTNSPYQDVDLVSRRIFLDGAMIRSALAADTNAQPILTYLVNLLSAGTNTTPYSMVTAAGAPWTPADMRDDEILVSQWLAEDLQVKPGDEIALIYFDPESGARLAERTNTFRVRGVVPMEMPWADRTLMPDFPGIEKAESTSEWDAGFPLVHEIRKKDDDYWKERRGTPKAFVTLAAGKKMWANRFGELTAIRFPIPTNSVGTRSTASQTSPTNGDAVERVLTNVEEYRDALERKILANLKPEELGLRFEPVREQALKAAEQSQDFGQLFLGFSFFLIIAAMLLVALLFSLGLEQRAPEIGTLLALGFTPKQVRRMLLREGIMLAFIGGVLGAAGGLAFARAMLQGLTTIWRDAVGATALSFHFTAQTLVIGLLASVVVSAVTIWMSLRKFVRRPATELLAGEVQSPESTVRSRGRLIAGVALAGALGLVGWTLAKGDTANAGAFFGAGALVLVAGLSFVSAWLSKLVGRPLTPAISPSDGERENRRQSSRESGLATAAFTLSTLGVRGCARRRKRSLATVAMLACGSFLIVSIGVFRLDANRDASKRTSGTGGFALIGETTMPVVHDLNTGSGRDFFALNESDLANVSFVPFRVREGDEASCLNLNRAQKPRLMGVRPEMLGGRFTFAKGTEWKALINTRLQPGESMVSESENRLNGFPQRATNNTGLKPGANEIEIPAIGDANSIQWAMKKKVGDTIDYVDERGQPFKVRIVGAVVNSILQGQLIIDEAEFVKRFPGESGYRMFLIDAPSNGVSQISATLSRAMQDVGLELTPAPQRLAQFNAVQNTYLGTFQVLGGLGLLLGSVGLGVVVLRNVLERRGELAVLLAVGFRTQVLQRLVLIEHGALLGLGLTLGVVAAAVAVLPALLSPAAQLPYASLTLTLGAVLINGALWTCVATRVALRGNLLEALRNE